VKFFLSIFRKREATGVEKTLYTLLSVGTTIHLFISGIRDTFFGCKQQRVMVYENMNSHLNFCPHVLMPAAGTDKSLEVGVV
jgi:hypothetical protein